MGWLSTRTMPFHPVSLGSSRLSNVWPYAERSYRLFNIGPYFSKSGVSTLSLSIRLWIGKYLSSCLSSVYSLNRMVICYLRRRTWTVIPNSELLLIVVWTRYTLNSTPNCRSRNVGGIRQLSQVNPVQVSAWSLSLLLLRCLLHICSQVLGLSRCQKMKCVEELDKSIDCLVETWHPFQLSRWISLIPLSSIADRRRHWHLWRRHSWFVLFSGSSICWISHLTPCMTRSQGQPYFQ